MKKRRDARKTRRKDNNNIARTPDVLVLPTTVAETEVRAQMNHST